jgi:hypothetical protein
MVEFSNTENSQATGLRFNLVFKSITYSGEDPTLSPHIYPVCISKIS